MILSKNNTNKGVKVITFDDQRIHIHIYTQKRQSNRRTNSNHKEIERNRKKGKNKDHNQISYKSFLEVRKKIFSIVTE